MTKPTPRNSGLYYYGTKDDLRLGDRIASRRLFRSPLYGTICYIPGISPKHSELGDDQWAFRTDDGAIYGAAYDRKYGQPGKGLILLSRGEGESLSPDEPLESDDHDVPSVASSGLFYRGTTTEVMLGDHVTVKRWFFSTPITGTVTHIPGLSPKNLEHDHAKMSEWVISLDDSSEWRYEYHPRRQDPGKNITFIRRASGV